MSCGLTSTIARDCLDASGSIETIYVAEWSRVSSVTENTSGQVTAISMTGNSKFLEYQIEKGVGNFTQTSTHSKENGTTVYDQVLTIPINKTSLTKDFILKLTGYNRLMIIVKDNNGEYKLMGRTGANMTQNVSTTGTALGDKQGYTLTFNAQEKQFAGTIDSSVISGIITSA